MLRRYRLKQSSRFQLDLVLALVIVATLIGAWLRLAISHPAYREQMFMLTSEQLPPGPDVLREPLRSFLNGFLEAAADGSELHRGREPHYNKLVGTHRLLARLAPATGRSDEHNEHKRLAREYQLLSVQERRKPR